MRKTKVVAQLLFALVLGATALTGCSSAEAEFGFMTGREAYEWIAGGTEAIILDVRSEEEFLTGHIEGSILLPLHELEERAEDILLDKDASILVICYSGNRSQIASQQLADLGFTNVYDIGGVVGWPGELVQ